MQLRDADECRHEAVALGEVMLRLDPGQARIHTARTFTAWEGGGEYNVARGLRRCFEAPTAIVTALADNPVGRLIETLMLGGGVDTRFVRSEPYDGVGESVRNGPNVTERGFDVRSAVGMSDRANSAAARRHGTVVSYDRNDWGAVAWSAESGFVTTSSYQDLEVFDRIGGGDAFAAGRLG